MGDIVGRPGREIIARLVKDLKEEEKIDIVVANGENAAGGSGLTPRLTEELLSSGIDVLTSGDHIWKKKEVYALLDSSKKLIRPANYPPGAPGNGYTIVDVPGKAKIAIVNLIGRVFMEAVDCPFQTVRKLLREIEKQAKVIIVDVHAEATSEKVALGWFLDGKVSAVMGTHTHIQTADEKILPKGTAYITDCGMTGPYDSVIGRTKERVIERFISQLPNKFDMATDGVEMHGVIIDIDDNTGKASGIQRIQKK